MNESLIFVLCPLHLITKKKYVQLVLLGGFVKSRLETSCQAICLSTNVAFERANPSIYQLLYQQKCLVCLAQSSPFFIKSEVKWPSKKSLFNKSNADLL